MKVMFTFKSTPDPSERPCASSKKYFPVYFLVISTSKSSATSSLKKKDGESDKN